MSRLLIGKKVRVTPEYHRSFEGQGGGVQERLFAAVLFDKADRNAAEARRPFPAARIPPPPAPPASTPPRHRVCVGLALPDASDTS